MKKTLTKVIACVMAFGFTFAATSCGGGSQSEAKKEENFIKEIGGVSETFTGAVSTESYATANEAATAYVETEIVGELGAKIEAMESKASYEGEQIAALNIPAELTAGAETVEEIEVEYSALAGGEYMSTAKSTKKVKVYVIKYTTDWKYYTPCPETGSTISKSYYDSVFNMEKYKNCTFDMDMEMDMSAKVSGGGYSQKLSIGLEMSQFVQYSETAIYIEQTMSMTGLAALGGEDVSTSICGYFETVGDSIVCYVQMDGSEWYEGDIETIGFSDLEELTPFYDQYLDFTYFQKTDFGFQLADEQAEKYIDLTLRQDESMGELIAMFGENFGMDMFVKYYVSEGVLSGMRMDMTMDAKMTEDGMTMTMDADVLTTMTCTNYGTTVVKKPASIG